MGCWMSSRDVRDGQLAIHGGEPICGPSLWHSWPRPSSATFELVTEVLDSGRWALSGPSVGSPSFNQRFTDAFAAFHDAPYCVATANGSSAIRSALRALGVGFGDEVIVPGLTWVACASAVLSLGAVPILVDVEEESLCLDPERVESEIGPATRAILVVHSLCSVADLDALVGVARRSRIPLVEDCAQAHGARYRGQRVGTFGDFGVFSMQQTKVLTSGEGGAVITSSSELADRVRQFRADGRRDVPLARSGEPGLSEVGDLQGYNACLSELHCALLVAALETLDEENRRRAECAFALDSGLDEAGYAKPVRGHSLRSESTVYQYCWRLDLDAFRGVAIGSIAAAMSAELGISVSPIYPPISRSKLYRPNREGSLPSNEAWSERLRVDRFDLPTAEAASAQCLAIPHQALLGGSTDAEFILDALEKVRRSAAHLVAS